MSGEEITIRLAELASFFQDSSGKVSFLVASGVSIPSYLKMWRTWIAELRQAFDAVRCQMQFQPSHSDERGTSL